MNIDHLREFVYLAETLSFAMTARHFFLSPSVLSKHIAAMEDELDVRLFDRGGRGVSLTEHGKAFYEDLLPVLDGYDHALSGLAARRAGSKLHLRIGYLRGACQAFLSDLMSCMAEMHPVIDVDLRCMEYGELIRAHRSRSLDLVISADLNQETADACDFERVCTGRLCAVVGRSHPIAQLAAVSSFAELAGERLLIPDAQAYPGLAQLCERMARSLDGITCVGSYGDIDTLCMRVANEDCVGVSLGCDSSCFGGQALFVPILDASASYSVSVRWLKGCDDRMASVGREVGEICARAMEGSCVAG